MKTEESNRFIEFLTQAQASFDSPDERLVYQIFEIPKRQIREINEDEKRGKLTSKHAEERRWRIQIIALSTVYKHVLNSWKTRDMLDDEFARYYRTVSGEEQGNHKSNEDVRRIEILRQFEDVRRVLQNGRPF